MTGRRPCGRYAEVCLCECRDAVATAERYHTHRLPIQRQPLGLCTQFAKMGPFRDDADMNDVNTMWIDRCSDVCNHLLGWTPQEAHSYEILERSRRKTLESQGFWTKVIQCGIYLPVVICRSACFASSSIVFYAKTRRYSASYALRASLASVPGLAR